MNATSQDARPPLPTGLGWKEKFLAGSLESEQQLLAQFTRQINELQESMARRADGIVRRGFHAKGIVGIANATFEVSANIVEPLRVGVFQPNQTYRAAVRFSNSLSDRQPDTVRQGRGIAIRIFSPAGFHDLLLSNSPASHARDALQFMAMASSLVHRSRLLVLFALIRRVGPGEAVRMLRAVRASSGVIASVATETYWSRTPYAFGPCAVRLVLRPTASVGSPAGTEPDYLRKELAARLRDHSIRFELFAQFFVDETRTPIEDGSVEWKRSDTPAVPVGALLIPSQDLDSSECRRSADDIELMQFNPWNVVGDILPLGSLNRARRLVYRASAERRRA